MSEATVRVRIAVAMARDSGWAAVGWADAPDDDAVYEAKEYLSWCDHDVGEPHVVYVEADVPLPPEPPTIAGKVEEADDG